MQNKEEKREKLATCFSSELGLENPPKSSTSLKERLEASKLFRHLCCYKTEKKCTSRLLPEQRTLIQDSWEKFHLFCSKKDCSPGYYIFSQLFSTCPQAAALFRFGKEKENISEMLQNHEFCRHLRVVSDVLDLTVRNIDELDVQVAPALISLGQRHCHKRGHEFRIDFWDFFAVATVDSINEALKQDGVEQEESEDVCGAWLLLAQYVIQKLKQGFSLEALERGKSQKRRSTIRRKPRDNVVTFFAALSFD